MKKTIILLWLSVLITSCSSSSLPVRELTVNNHTLSIEIARSDKERAKGLMNREELGESEGMLFVFENDEKRTFWMKNTPLPLSIAYISREGIVLEIYDMKPYSLERIKSRNECRYALEVNQGAFDIIGIKAGTYLDIKKLLLSLD